MQKFLNWLVLLNWTLIVAGFAGGTAYALKKGDDLSWYSKIGVILTGIMTSYYCAEWLASRVGVMIGAMIAPEGTVPVPVQIPIGPAGFVCGLCAQTIVSGLIEFAEKKETRLRNS